MVTAYRENERRQFMTQQTIVYSIFLIFFGAACLATLALFARQSMLLAYILVGILAGPWGLQLVDDLELISQISHVGIIFLLFLLGMNLEPQDLARFFQQTTVVTLISSTVFFISGTGLSLLFGFTATEAVIIGISMMFSSTIIGLKLLPTTALHHQHMGEIIVSILLLQDIIAIIALLGIQSAASADFSWWHLSKTLIALPALAGGCFLVSRYCLQALLARFDRIQEYIFLVTIGWCLAVSELAHILGLSYEIGAFIGGVSLAISPIARFITESLKPLRDFFLVMFFFSLGASFDISQLGILILPAGAIACTMLILKPLTFRVLLQRQGENRSFAAQTGARLGHISEFSLLIAIMALNAGLISGQAAYLIQITTLITFAVSSYYIGSRYPTPIAVDDNLRKD